MFSLITAVLSWQKLIMLHNLLQGQSDLHLLCLFNPLYTGGLFCNMLDKSICNFRCVGGGGEVVSFILFLMENPVSKQCRP